VRPPRLLSEAHDADADVVAQFVASLHTHRDRAMPCRGLRNAEVRSVRLTDVDFD
jgi:integrase/recombinase XerC